MKIRNVTFFVLLMAFGGCKTQPDAKAVRKEVLNIHDKLMVDGEKVIKNKMTLDALLASDAIKSLPDSAVKKQTISNLIKKLNKADENMMDWMHFFKDDFKGKNEQEDLAYFKSQMIKIRDVEDGYIKVTKSSDSLLKIYNITDAKDVIHSTHKH
ncbi:hypothetical protein EZJ43_12120 [Pedobacter changchengzhani]|uniref:Uncharacterized protein n=1 Tax=Pedobacter changchengzhani TaxID=2529274 RepID=A0A4R5MJI6_9SPHI|nr:hypothetical protein [Pedobacter changchengzhani]TDG35760.1 hypothetical protein EZJ43_12120 [Pedobacter changchengzhani]